MEKEVKLDERYVCNRQDGKNVILDKINLFINQCPSFAPRSLKPLCDKTIINYCDENNYVILDEYFFASKIPNKLRSVSYYYGGCHANDVAIVSCMDKTKKILVRRNNGKVKEISTLLGVDTLYLIYEVFVKNVISYSYSLRKLKEKKYEVESLNKQSNVLYYTKVNSENASILLYGISNIVFDMSNRTVNYTSHTYRYNPNTSFFHLDTVVTNNLRNLPNFFEVIERYKSMDKITSVELFEKVKRTHEAKMELYSQNIEDSLRTINSININ